MAIIRNIENEFRRSEAKVSRVFLLADAQMIYLSVLIRKYLLQYFNKRPINIEIFNIEINIEIWLFFCFSKFLILEIVRKRNRSIYFGKQSKLSLPRRDPRSLISQVYILLKRLLKLYLIFRIAACNVFQRNSRF